ncbi:MAG: DNA repair protein RadC [Candidatus Competibacteraceae bacterium]|nr:DNA repair protein RadC [Candidatus Competibacteraceae bacterium]
MKKSTRGQHAATLPLLQDASGAYSPTQAQLSEAEILAAAEAIIERRFYRQASLSCPEDAAAFLRAKLVLQPHELFGGLFLDQRHRVIAWQVLFTGTIDGCSVHPREVIRQALAYNAAAVILAHQHPSGCPEPSQADVQLTRRLRDALALVDIRVLDHLVIGAQETVSLAQRDLL